MKIWHPLLATLFAVAPAACDRGPDSGGKVAQNETSQEKARTFGELTVDQVAEKIGKPGVFVFDNNPRHEWEQGHVPGATWVDYKALTAADLPADKNATLIFYCKNEH